MTTLRDAHAALGRALGLDGKAAPGSETPYNLAADLRTALRSIAKYALQLVAADNQVDDATSQEIRLSLAAIDASRTTRTAPSAPPAPPPVPPATPVPDVPTAWGCVLSIERPGGVARMGSPPMNRSYSELPTNSVARACGPLGCRRCSITVVGVLRRRGATRVVLFGSLATGAEPHASTDIDVMVEGLKLADCAEALLELEAMLEVPIDLVHADSASERLGRIDVTDAQGSDITQLTSESGT